MRKSISLLVSSLLAACAPDGSVDEAGYAQEVAPSATLTFDAQWNERQQGTLIAGRTARIVYDPARLTGCRGDMYGRPAWAITGWMRGADGVTQSFLVAPQEAGAAALTVTLPSTPGPVSFWFQNNSRWGCNAWDSDNGRNYTFHVAADPRAPGWMGDAAAVISRATCNNGFGCDADRRSLEIPWTYETWARQRAAIRAAYFDVWKQGVTDFDNPSLWQQLDVRVHYRFRPDGAFAWRHVNFERRVGNNARFRLDLASVDPLADAPVPRTTCPDAALTRTADGAYVSTVMEYYFTVNGAALRPSVGATFRGTFANYRTPLLDTCIGR